MNSTTFAIIFAALIIGGSIMFSQQNNPVQNTAAGIINVNNVSVSDGKQIVSVNVKGGYSPKKSVAKAEVPTTLRLITDGTYDCSSSIRIPSFGISKNLPQTGATDIDLGTPKAGVINGTCGMGMYSFQISFE